MNVGILQFRIRLPESQSLKEKRHVIKSLLAHLHTRYSVSAAEVDAQDMWQVAVIAVACLSNDKRHTNDVLNTALTFASTYDIEMLQSDIELIDI